MTQNQIAYWRDVETKRSNLERERQNFLDLVRKQIETEANVDKTVLEQELLDQKINSEIWNRGLNTVDTLVNRYGNTVSNMIGAAGKNLFY